MSLAVCKVPVLFSMVTVGTVNVAGDFPARTISHTLPAFSTNREVAGTRRRRRNTCASVCPKLLPPCPRPLSYICLRYFSRGDCRNLALHRTSHGTQYIALQVAGSTRQTAIIIEDADPLHSRRLHRQSPQYHLQDSFRLAAVPYCAVDHQEQQTAL
jgi:hypothetical protein